MADSRFGELIKELNSEPMKIEIKDIGNNQGSRADNAEFLQQKQFELMVEMATKKLELKLEAMKEETASLKLEVDRLKVMRQEPVQQVQVANTPSAPTSDAIKVPDDVQVEGFMEIKSPSRHVMSLTSEHAKGEGTQVHPRLGNYKTEDVSVEKFFNFGRK